ncbi:MAG: DNA polymerase III subunit beta [Deltaproteobacteria bacterium RIFOXYD12_FULL_50_9]|nr:MAG: DNA polymerase III subunit beta [Deltaproteobacteria bacterium RIFOXYD12_FULL_50_9]
MRLREEERKAIVTSVLRIDPAAEIYLFGSRVDDNRKGGDIDVLILSGILNFVDKLAIKKSLFRTLDEQKIDIVIARDKQTPFVALALEKSIRLQ